jgi:hypothetical protein
MLHPFVTWEFAKARRCDLIKTAEAAARARTARASRHRVGAESVPTLIAWWRTWVPSRRRSETQRGIVEAGASPLDALQSGAELSHRAVGLARAGGPLLVTRSTEETST